ncbi:1-acyl-sn-glycerol-3-phosphate acyltransferase [Komagataeibacter xylinus NBRC 13693]|uniref:1-acyl-sn-glycerol-3-phosphate acyltransferase n=1 Tax=Komagataeibacter xylinus NBRC 13693 TaxID=1234668 RepID=A0A0D6Q6E2_KOMXY|nr:MULTISPECIES: lysophospholipid acyltransferase family protein [Komagataeibacter]GAN99014.1 1-acyl-sn-glycerol-3-phosphate acyltransferase [Komagataeibacter xylinus NBRC 13693]
MIADFIRRFTRRRSPSSAAPPSTSRAARPVIAPQPGSVAERLIAATTVLPSGRMRAYARTARGVGRLAAITVWVPLSVGFEAVLLLVPGTAKIRWTRMVWGGLCLLLSLRIRVVGRRAGGVGGRRARQNGERPVIYVSNHSSWLDVPVLGTVLPSNFVAKGDIEGWPIMGLVSRIGRTIFVSRQRSTTGRERDEMLHRLMVEGDNLILFPEGTSSDGSRVLPFLSAFFAIAKPPRLPPGRGPVEPESEAEAIAARPGMTPLIQPVSVVYDQLEGLPVNHARRPVFAWYGDMELGPHVWQLVKWRSMRATVLLHPPLDPNDFPSRKALAQAAWRAVAAGAAELRQNQPQPEGESAYACRPLAGMLPQDLERSRN